MGAYGTLTTRTLTTFRNQLEESRKVGYPFDLAWKKALRSIPKNGSGYRPVLSEQRDVWQRAYDDLPATSPEKATRLLAEIAP